MIDESSPEKPQLLSYRNFRNVSKAEKVVAGSAEPKCLGRYQIEAELGRGAMGMVYKAHDPRIHRTVAIKIINILGANPSEADAHRMRFVREAQAAGRLSHPGIVTIHDVDEDPISRIPYIVMEYVPGKRLDTFVAGLPSQRLSLQMSLSLALQIA
jgi:eukaryotic-like serine/threonine-protein kinase